MVMHPDASTISANAVSRRKGRRVQVEVDMGGAVSLPKVFQEEKLKALAQPAVLPLITKHQPPITSDRSPIRKAFLKCQPPLLLQGHAQLAHFLAQVHHAARKLIAAQVGLGQLLADEVDELPYLEDLSDRHLVGRIGRIGAA